MDALKRIRRAARIQRRRQNFLPVADSFNISVKKSPKRKELSRIVSDIAADTSSKPISGAFRSLKSDVCPTEISDFRVNVYGLVHSCFTGDELGGKETSADKRRPNAVVRRSKGGSRVRGPSYAR